MTTKKTALLSLSFLFIMAAFTGCIPEEPLPTVEYDITDLYGKWESGTEYYEYFSDGSGLCWDEGDGVYEDEAQKFTWEVDEFAGKNEGLIVAEIELDSPDREFPVPPWLGREVSHEPRFRNSRLVRHPYSEWTDEEKQ